MKNTKQEIEKIVRQIMVDTEREYYEDRKIHIDFMKNEEVLHINKTIENCWLINVSVHDDQFNRPEPATIIMYMNDDTNKIECYLDCSMGRPFPLAVVLNEKGKYEFAAIEK